MGQREKDIKLLVRKFIKLVESLEPGERLSIKKVAPKKRTARSSEPRKRAANSSSGRSA